MSAREIPDSESLPASTWSAWLPLAILLIGWAITFSSWEADGIALAGAWLTILLAVAVSALQRAALRKAALVASELRFRQVVEHVGAVFWLWSLDTRALEYVSPGYETIWGRPRANLQTHPDAWLEHVLPADRHLARLDHRSRRTEPPYEERSYRIVRPDGTIRWIRDRSFLSRDADGIVRAVAGLAEDVTQQRESAALLAGERAILAMVAAHAPLGETLTACCGLIESLRPGVRSAVLLREPHASVLTCVAAPGLPPDVPARPASALDASAAWSYPMLDNAGTMLGTLAVYPASARPPSADDAAIIERVRALVTIAIERQHAEDALRLTQFAIDHVADQIFLVAPDGHFLDVNPAACRRLGYTRAELLGMAVADIDPDLPHAAWPATWAELQRLQQWRFETHHRTKAGETYPVELTANYVAHAGRSYSYAIVRDISEWRRSLRALEDSEERFRLATEAGRMGTWEWQVTTAALRWSPNLLGLFGLPPATMVPGPQLFVHMIHADDRARLATKIAATVRGEDVGEVEFRIVWPDESVHWIANSSRIHRDETGRSVRIVGIVMDIERRKRAERDREDLLAERSAANAMLTRLSRQLLEVQENERRDLSRDLHDEIGQCIAAAKINLELLARRFPALEAQAPMEDTVALLDHILQHVSRLCLELRPSVLDDLGLAAALRWYVQRQSERSGWTGRFRADDMPVLSERLQSVCFRTVQEALTNVMRHAKAQTVDVELRRDADRLVLRIADDGVGFDPSLRPARGLGGGGLGLLGMRERLSSVGGELHIESAPGHGTALEARIDLGAELTAPLQASGSA